MDRCELLAPAGSIESLYAAVQSGADAVYLGGNRFSARAYASNFDDETMNKVVDYCHLYGKKVYVTLNTLIKENEIPDAVDYIKFLYRIGVDALIIQDTGIAYILNHFFPDFEVHASTQMTIHNASGAEYLSNSGFKRIVLARELSLEEIREISIEKKIPTEIFVHGALCICYSGQCLMSSVIGGRSGNRGRCAQPCRLPYRIINKNNNEEKQGYLLSPKDICTIEELGDIIKSGTSSLKIEGRMKRPEYVSGVVESYRKAIDSVYGNDGTFKVEPEKERLLQLFNREGFSKAYLYGNTGKDMMAYSYPKNTGILLGEVLKDFSITLKSDINVNDGVRFGEDGFTVSKITKDSKEVMEARKGDRVKLYPISFKPGDILYKTSDVKLLNELSKNFEDPYGIRINIDMEVDFSVGKPLILKTLYHEKEYIVTGDIIQKALNKPIEKGRLEESLRKTGESPFTIANIKYINFDNGFLPISSINAIRRELIESITFNETEKYKREAEDDKYNEINSIINSKYSVGRNKYINADKKAEYIISVNSPEQLRAVEELGMDNVAVDLYKRDVNKLIVEDIKCKNVYLKIPNIIRTEFNTICAFIERNLPFISGLVTANLGIINLFKGKTKIIGDYKLNVFNSFSVNYFKNNVDIIPLSIELNKKEMSQVAAAIRNSADKNVKVQAVVYGKTELMVSEYCPIGSAAGGKSEKCNCSSECEKGRYVLRDRKEEEFIIMNDRFCRSYIYNTVPTNLLPFTGELLQMGIENFRLDFIDEDYNETFRILSQLQNDSAGILEGNYTKGHYKRGVE